MRPKVVILTLLVTFGLLGFIILFKGLHSNDSAVQTPGQTANGDSGSGAGTNGQGSQGLNPTNTTAVSDDVRAAVIAKEVDQIQELQGEVDGTNNPTIISALLDKMAQPEAEVRSAALEALKEMDDTNAVPGLKKAADGIQDARQKVAVLDVIDYLLLPHAMPDVQPPETLTNPTPIGVILPDDKMNQHFLHKSKQNGSAQSNAVQPNGSSVPAN